ncbi:MAG: tautomerase family protein [Coriobacteriia bacterium]|nr:tautomerase family protein [Coriobacteriia bacterium]
MPIVRIDIQAGKSAAYKRAVLDGVREAIVSTLGVPSDRVMQRLAETPAQDVDAPSKTDRLTIVEISMLPGRGSDLKERLYEMIVARLGNEPGISASDIMVLVNDPAAECFAIGGVIQCTIRQAPQSEDTE